MDFARSNDLVARARANDREAIDELFAHYAPIVRRGLRKLLGERYRRQLGDSEDATQDALLAAFSSLDQYEPREGSTFLGWVLCIAEREVRGRVRANDAQKRGGGKQRHLESVDSEPKNRDATPSQVASGHELEERVRAAVDELPESERDVILLHRYLGLGTAAIREQLALTTDGAVRALLSRARTRLAERLDLP